MNVITLCNQKGGVGKTTTAHSLGAGLRLKGFKVLLIDLDPQGNLSYMTGATAQPMNAHAVLSGVCTAEQAIQPGGIICSASQLSGADIEFTFTGKEYKLKEALKPLKNNYDFVVIDTPPALGILTVNALTASNSLIITAQADILSLQGIGQLYATIQAIKTYTNPELIIQGVLLTRYNKRSILSRDITESIQDTAEQLKTNVFKTCIRECTALKEAQASKQDIFAYAPRSNASEDYNNFISEVLERGKYNG